MSEGEVIGHTGMSVWRTPTGNLVIADMRGGERVMVQAADWPEVAEALLSHCAAVQPLAERLARALHTLSGSAGEFADLDEADQQRLLDQARYVISGGER